MKMDTAYELATAKADAAVSVKASDKVAMKFEKADGKPRAKNKELSVLRKKCDMLKRTMDDMAQDSKMPYHVQNSAELKAKVRDGI